MKEVSQFNQIIHQWADVFMRRSMADFITFAKTTGFSMTQISTLMRIHHQRVCGVSDLGEYLGVTNAASSQMIHKLVEQGILERSEDPKDRRNKLITLTEQGKTLVDGFIKARHGWIQNLEAELSEQEQSEIITALTHLIQATDRLNPVDKDSIAFQRKIPFHTAQSTLVEEN
jgi:DNA-binding MarR family transcriptional regulator